MKYRKYILVLIVSIIIYLLLIFFYNKYMVKDNFKKCYTLKEDVLQGQTVDISNLKECKIDAVLDGTEYIEDINLYVGCVFSHDVRANDILKKKDLVNSEEYQYTQKYEYISIKVESSEDSVSYQSTKGKNVNIYYSSKTSQLDGIINLIAESGNEISEYITLGIQEPYTTIKLLKDVYIIDAFNKSGISLDRKELLGTDTLIDTIMIRVTSDLAIKINNLKNYGKFSFSIVR